VVNAVVHADYSQTGAPIRISLFDDRLEVENPGILPVGLTIEDIWQGVSKLRNRVIGRVFKELNLIEQWGSGIPRMAEACASAGLPAPVLEEVGMRFRATIHTTPTGPEQTDESNAVILKAIRTAGGLSTKELAQRIGVSSRAIRARLKQLSEQGLVRAIGKGPNDPRRRYYATSEEHPR
jgi:predicted HTH transcriptional regulator